MHQFWQTISTPLASEGQQGPTWLAQDEGHLPQWKNPPQLL
jgi:hypothetical protein